MQIAIREINPTPLSQAGRDIRAKDDVELAIESDDQNYHKILK